MVRMTQCDKIVAWMKEAGGITQRDAFYFGCQRLASRIHDLKLTIIESILVDDFDPVCEQKCRQCICYGMCKEHGCHYECPDYMTEEMLRRKGMEHESKERRA